MKRIVTMTGEGFASRSLSHKITPVTVFTGPNRRGKTTRLNLVAWILAGYVPNVAARSSDVYKELGIGQNMTGELTFDDGSFIRRRLIGQKSGVKASITQQGFADDFAVPPVLVDAREFLNLSERERVKFVFRLTSSAADRSKVGQTVIANLKGLKLNEHTPEAEAALTDLVAEVQNTIEEGARDNKPVNELVDELCEQVRTAKNEADANSKRMAKTNEGVAQVAQDEAPPAPDCEHRLTQARAHHREKFGRMTEIKTELQQVQRQIEQAREAEKQVQGEQLIRNQIEQLEANPPASPMAVGTKPELQKMAEPRPITANEQARLNEARQRLDEAKRVLDDSLFSVRKIELEIAQAEKQTHCPTCGHDITDTQKQIVANLRNALAAAWAVNTSKTAVMATAQGIWSDAEKDLQAANQAVANWDRSKKTMEDENQRVLDAWNEANELHNRAQQVVNQHQAALNRLRQTLAKTAEQASIAAKLPALEQEYQKLQNQADAATLDNDQAFNECTRLESEVRRLHAQREQAAQRARVDEERRLHEVRSALLKLALTMMEELRALLVEQSVRPFLSQVNEICQPVLERPVEYKDGSLGFRQGDGLISKSMCGAERALVAAALSVTLAVQSPIKLLLLDELGWLDPDNKLKLVRLVLRLVRQGKLDQALLADPDCRPYAGEKDEQLSLVQL